MKLRLRENSIRLRLLQSEVRQFAANGEITETITFSSAQTLVYKLKSSENAQTISAFFENGEVTVEIPAELASNWIATNLVGLQNEINADDGATLKILIEKDFVCLERPLDKDNADAFPHPTGSCQPIANSEKTVNL